MNIPYEQIGQVTVAVLVTLAVLIALAALVFIVALVWVRTWSAIMRACWYGYHPTDEAPPGIRRKLAIVAYGMAHFERPSNIHEAIRDAHELE